MITESFIMLKYVQSIKVPETTYKSLQAEERKLLDKSAEVEIIGADEIAERDAKKDHLGDHCYELVLMIRNNDPLKIRMYNLSHYHLMSQAMTTLVHTKKDRLAYYTVILGL